MTSGSSGRGRHVLVTGGAGFIGSHLVEALLAGGSRVTVLDDLSTGSLDNLAAVADHAALHFVRGDARAPLAPQLDGERPDHIVHLAAQISVVDSVADPYNDLDQNVVATLRVIDLARALGVRRVVFASSAATYGDGPQPSSEALLPLPASPYGLHKLTSEQHLRIAGAIDRVPAVSLRFFNVYGPRQVPTSAYAGVISIFIQRALALRPLELFGGGVATRDFVYVADVVRAIAFALESEAVAGGVFNVGTGRSTSVRDLAETIVAVTGSSSPLVDAPARPGEALHSRADIARLGALGWRPLTSLSEGLAATAAWMGQKRSA